jgi:hypothetical protein
MADARDEFIAAVVPGRTFADVGGLWGIVGERVSVAYANGASELSMIDVTVEGGELWKAFETRMRDRGIADYRCISSDVCTLENLAFDVVHCSGVLYHHPSPQLLLGALRRLTREHLILTSAITQESVTNAHGKYRIPASGVIFVPALEESERLVLAEYWREVGAEVHGITHPVRYTPQNFGPWWWLPTARALIAMAETADFEVVDQTPTWGGNAHTLLLRPGAM